MYIRGCGVQPRNSTKVRDNDAGLEADVKAGLEADLKMPPGTSIVPAMNDAIVTSRVTPSSDSFDVVVIGGGPAGLAAAIAVAQTGATTALIARRLPYSDNRTTALLGGSIDLLRALDVWPRARDKAAELRVMRLVDDTGRLIGRPKSASPAMKSDWKRSVTISRTGCCLLHWRNAPRRFPV